jgi:crotonobetainyl-CoA:carnitine CoA-transferase CaiB-like acyl-CoA transferase
MWVLSPDINISAVTEVIPMQQRGAPANPLVNNYKTRDGRWIQLCMLQADRDWPDFCRHIGREEWTQDPRWADIRRRAENAQALVEELDAVFAARPLAEWRKQLATLQGAWTPVQTPRELHQDPQALANGYLRDVEGADGSTFQLVASPVQYDEEAPDLRPAPEHGQHTEEVLLELGLSWDEIVKYKEARAIL